MSIFVDEIPHTATGKIQKITLRERLRKTPVARLPPNRRSQGERYASS